VAPVANAGADKTVWLPVETVTLDGSNSTDDQHITSYQWTCASYRSHMCGILINKRSSNLSERAISIAILSVTMLNILNVIIVAGSNIVSTF